MVQTLGLPPQMTGVVNTLGSYTMWCMLDNDSLRSGRLCVSSQTPERAVVSVLVTRESGVNTMLSRFLCSVLVGKKIRNGESGEGNRMHVR